MDKDAIANAMEESRQRLRIPDDWLYTECAAAGCAEQVWYPPSAAAAQANLGPDVVVVCSSNCAATMTVSR